MFKSLIQVIWKNERGIQYNLLHRKRKLLECRKNDNFLKVILSLQILWNENANEIIFFSHAIFYGIILENWSPKKRRWKYDSPQQKKKLPANYRYIMHNNNYRCVMYFITHFCQMIVFFLTGFTRILLIARCCEGPKKRAAHQQQTYLAHHHSIRGRQTRKAIKI